MAFFSRNIDGRGRVVRLGMSLLAGGAAWWLKDSAPWAALGLACGAVLGAIEALRGWCLARACGLKTPL